MQRFEKRGLREENGLVMNMWLILKVGLWEEKKEE